MATPFTLAAPLVTLAVVGAVYLTVPTPPPPSLPVRVETAIALQKMEIWDQSGRAFAEVLRDDPKNVRANFAIGVAAYQAKRFSEAEERLKTALAGDPGNIEIKLSLGVSYQKAKRYKEAQAIYQELRREHPDDLRPLNNLAEIEIARGEYVTARRLLEEYLAKLPAKSPRRKHAQKRIKRLTAAIGDKPSPTPSKK